MLQINNVRHNVIYFDPYICQALSGPFTFCNFIKPCKGSIINQYKDVETEGERCEVILLNPHSQLQS